MENLKQLHEIALKWINKFRDENADYPEFVDHFMADDFDALGFAMDCGNAFAEKYDRAVYDSDELLKIIDSVTDISLLGSAIYSRWRYFNHWAYSGEEILNPKNREWFIIAFERLEKLSKNKD